MKFLIGFALVVLFICSSVFRCACFNPGKTIINGYKDLRDYVKYKKWNNASCGELVAYVGLFGKGKTLSAVHTVVNRYKRYNNKRVFDIFRFKSLSLIASKSVKSKPISAFILLAITQYSPYCI